LFPGSSDSSVPGSGAGAAQGHVDDGFGSAIFSHDVLDSPFESFDDSSCGAGVALKYFDGDKGCFLCYAIGRASDSASDVSIIFNQLNTPTAL
jgi:hypothetical protein